VKRPPSLAPCLSMRSTVASMRPLAIPWSQRSGRTDSGPKYEMEPQPDTKFEPTSSPPSSAAMAVSGSASPSVGVVLVAEERLDTGKGVKGGPNDLIGDR
jgi:hypothetical protein